MLKLFSLEQAVSRVLSMSLIASAFTSFNLSAVTLPVPLREAIGLDAQIALLGSYF